MIGLKDNTFGQYQIHERISRGGMAAIYRATQTSVGRTVAIKVLSPNFMEDRTFFDNFMREVKIIARLQHPKILPVYDFGKHKDIPYIVMAYLDGGTLENRIKQGPMSLDEIIDFVKQIAEGLDYAHSQSIIHRDFKPSNVLLDSNNNTYLADFGIAKVEEATAHVTGSTIIGTPAYMAPEVFVQARLTKAVDLYALGVTAFQMLTGKHPYAATGIVQLMNAHLHEPIPNVCRLRHDLPNATHKVIARAMAKSPDARFGSAKEMADTLAVALGDAIQPAQAAIQSPKIQPSSDPPPDDSTVELPLDQLADQQEQHIHINRVERIEFVGAKRGAIGRLLRKPLVFIGLLLSVVVIVSAGIFGSYLLQADNPLSISAIREAATQFGNLIEGFFRTAGTN